ERIRKGDAVVAGIGWGRRDSATVEDVRRNPYDGMIVRIKTEDGRELLATPNHMMFGRFDLDSAKYYVYLMYQRRHGYRIGLTRGMRSGRHKQLELGFQQRTNQEVADRVWLLATCDSRAEAQYLEAYFAFQYGLPAMVFHVRGRRIAVTQQHIDRLYDEIDTPLRAKQLMADLLLFEDYP